MKVYVYESWQWTPGNFARPFKTAGRPVFSQEVQNPKQVQKMVSKWFFTGKSLHETQKYLAFLKDKDGYENALIGSKKECWGFIKDCLSDVGIMSARRGKKTK